MSNSAYTENQKALVKLAYNRSQDAIQAQQQIANAADQRSLVFASLCVASSALVFGALARSTALGIGAGASLFYLVAAILAATTSFPQKFYPPGSKARDLESHISNDLNETEVLWGLCNNNDDYIDRNQRGAATRGTVFSLSIIFFLSGSLIAAVGILSADFSLLLGENQ